MIKEMLKNIGSGKPFVALVGIDNDGLTYGKFCYTGKFYVKLDSVGFNRVDKKEFITTVNKVAEVIDYNDHDIFDRYYFSIREIDIENSDLRHRHKKLSIICDS